MPASATPDQVNTTDIDTVAMARRQRDRGEDPLRGSPVSTSNLLERRGEQPRSASPAAAQYHPGRAVRNHRLSIRSLRKVAEPRTWFCPTSPPGLGFAVTHAGENEGNVHESGSGVDSLVGRCGRSGRSRLATVRELVRPRRHRQPRAADHQGPRHRPRAATRPTLHAGIAPVHGADVSVTGAVVPCRRARSLRRVRDRARMHRPTASGHARRSGGGDPGVHRSSAPGPRTAAFGARAVRCRRHLVGHSRSQRPGRPIDGQRSQRRYRRSVRSGPTRAQRERWRRPSRRRSPTPASR